MGAESPKNSPDGLGRRRCALDARRLSSHTLLQGVPPGPMAFALGRDASLDVIALQLAPQTLKHAPGAARAPRPGGGLCDASPCTGSGHARRLCLGVLALAWPLRPGPWLRLLVGVRLALCSRGWGDASCARTTMSRRLRCRRRCLQARHTEFIR